MTNSPFGHQTFTKKTIKGIESHLNGLNYKTTTILNGGALLVDLIFTINDRQIGASFQITATEIHHLDGDGVKRLIDYHIDAAAIGAMRHYLQNLNT
jgi:hypothetical protein